MATNEMDARLISQGAEATQIGSEALVSVSEGAGQPQKNIQLGNFADSMAKAVPQKTKDQVSITGLYAKTTDGKMVELTSDSVASVVAGLMGNPMGFKGQASNANEIKETGIYDLFTNNSHESNDTPSAGYSMTLLSFRTNRQGLQLAFAYGNVGPFYRITEDVNNWVSRAWKTFSTN